MIPSGNLLDHPKDHRKALPRFKHLAVVPLFPHLSGKSRISHRRGRKNAFAPISREGLRALEGKPQGLRRLGEIGGLVGQHLELGLGLGKGRLRRLGPEPLPKGEGELIEAGKLRGKDVIQPKDVHPELRLHRPPQLPRNHGEERLLEGPHEGASGRRTESPAIARGTRVIRKFLSQRSEILPSLEACEKRFGQDPCRCQIPIVRLREEDMGSFPLFLPFEGGLLAFVGGEHSFLGDHLRLFKVEAIKAEGFYPHPSRGAVSAPSGLEEGLKGFIADRYLSFEFAGREAQPGDIPVLKQHGSERPKLCLRNKA